MLSQIELLRALFFSLLMPKYALQLITNIACLSLSALLTRQELLASLQERVQH